MKCVIIINIEWANHWETYCQELVPITLDKRGFSALPELTLCFCVFHCLSLKLQKLIFFSWSLGDSKTSRKHNIWHNIAVWSCFGEHACKHLLIYPSGRQRATLAWILRRVCVNLINIHSPFSSGSVSFIFLGKIWDSYARSYTFFTS